MNGFFRSRRSAALYVNGKWLAQSASGTQRYATQVVSAAATSAVASRITLVLPSDAEVPPWAQSLEIVSSRFRGTLFEQVALPWIARRGHLYSLAGPAPLLKRNQTVVMHDAMPFQHPETFKPLFVLWYRLMYTVLARLAARLLTVSSFSRSELAVALGVAEGRFDLAPCGADHVKDASLGSWELPFAAGTYALIVGNLAPHKNVAAAATALADSGVPVAVVGGVQLKVFREPQTPAGAGIRMLGRVDDAALSHLIAGAGVLVAPSRYEGFGIPVIEAGRLGCPAVIATGSALTEVAGTGGVHFDPDDIGECVRQVRRVLGDAALRATLSEAARRNACRFSWSGTAATVFAAPKAEDADDGSPSTSSRPIRVLHVTESFLAGTGMALVGFAEATRAQGVESYLLAQDRQSGLLDDLNGALPFERTQLVGSGTVRLWRAIGPAVASIRPDVVHLHSSVAGVVGRLRIGSRQRPAVVYSPHCFAFERRDVARPWRWAYLAVEKVLAWRTDCYVCVSPHEAELAGRLRRATRVTNVVNSFDVVGSGVPETVAPDRDGVLRIVTAGRVVPQKDPAIFAAVVEKLRRYPGGTGVEASWIGPVISEDLGRLLEKAGVRLAGWVPPHQMPKEMATHTVYLHTASWEAAVPIAVLDAMRAGVPVVVRRNDAYVGMVPQEWQFTELAEAVTMIRRLADEATRARRVQEQSDVLRELKRWSPEVCLASAYRDVLRTWDRQPCLPIRVGGGADG
jgi:glycosyltransferase involved in cell wall biosynthesis